MNRDILKGKWNQLKGSARTKWGQLTDDDVDMVQGDAERLFGLLQEKYGRNREWAEREVNDLLDAAIYTENAGEPSDQPLGSRDFTDQREQKTQRKRRAS
jgi:uncharacterized protein YjbJ (UPF0337 family)